MRLCAISTNPMVKSADSEYKIASLIEFSTLRAFAPNVMLGSPFTTT